MAAGGCDRQVALPAGCSRTGWERWPVAGSSIVQTDTGDRKILVRDHWFRLDGGRSLPGCQAVALGSSRWRIARTSLRFRHFPCKSQRQCSRFAAARTEGAYHEFSSMAERAVLNRADPVDFHSSATNAVAAALNDMLAEMRLAHARTEKEPHPALERHMLHAWPIP